MPTKKPLAEMLPDIVSHYLRYQEYLQFNNRLYRILEGQVRLEVEESLRKEILSKSALNRALQRIPSINIMKKGVDKLSKVYIESPLRLADNETDQEILRAVSREMSIDTVMMEANRIYNAHHTFALEPYVKDGKHQMRVLAGHQFLPYSDDTENPLNTTVFIKLMGSELKEIRIEGDDKGNRTDDTTDIRQVDILALYSDDEFMIIDSGGVIRTDKMAEMGITSTVNPFGRIPFIIGNKSAFELIPFPNQGAFDMSVLIPKLLTDLNYAAQFMSHSIIWTKNADLSGQEVNPDTIVDLGETSENNGDPEIGTIDPKVDIERILKLIEFEMSSYFSSIGIKVSVSGSLSPGREESGVSKAIDEGDISAERKIQTEFFRKIEAQLWDLLDDVQRVWVREGRITEGERRIFSEDFIKSFRMKFAEIKTMKTHAQLLEEIKLSRDMKLMSRAQALRLLNPDYTEKQIQEILEEVDQESDDEMERMTSLGSPDDNDGQFRNGNQEGSEQDPATNLESRR
jgi:hypothetical protein